MEQGTQDKILTVLYTTGIIGFLIGIARGVIEERHGGWVGFARGILSAMLVSVLVGLGLVDTQFPPAMQACIVGVCAYISEDIVLGLRKIAGEAAKDPVGILRALIAWRRGRKE